MTIGASSIFDGMLSGMEGLSTEACEQVAAYFQALAEPTRLQILNLLRDGELNVGELAAACGYTSANISRHLAYLTRHGLVERESRGTSVYYRIADDGPTMRCATWSAAASRDSSTCGRGAALVRAHRAPAGAAQEPRAASASVSSSTYHPHAGRRPGVPGRRRALLMSSPCRAE